MPTILAQLGLDGENGMRVFLIFKLAPARFYRSKTVWDLGPQDGAWLSRQERSNEIISTRIVLLPDNVSRLRL